MAIHRIIERAVEAENSSDRRELLSQASGEHGRDAEREAILSPRQRFITSSTS